MGLTYRDETHSSEIGKDGDNEQWDGVEETDEHEEYPAHCLLTPDFSSGFIQVLPDLPGYQISVRLVAAIKKAMWRLTISLGLGARAIAVPLTRLSRSILATMWA